MLVNEVRNGREMEIITIIFELLLSIGLCDTACVHACQSKVKRRRKKRNT